VLFRSALRIQYGFAIKDGRDAIQLERKEDMKKRGLASPDNGDALALTFAYSVAPSDHTPHFFRRSRMETRRARLARIEPALAWGCLNINHYFEAKLHYCVHAGLSCL
jgi:hypothetical protein